MKRDVICLAMFWLMLKRYVPLCPVALRLPGLRVDETRCYLPGDVLV